MMSRMSSRFLSLAVNLFLLTRLNNLSMPALECGVVSINFATLNSNLNLRLFPIKDLSRLIWYHKIAIRYSFEPSSYSFTMASSLVADDSSESLKDLKSINSSNNVPTLQSSYWGIPLYFSTKLSTWDHLASWRDWKSIYCAISKKLQLTSILRSVYRNFCL